MKGASNPSLPAVPVSYVLVLLGILEERGIARDAALRDTGIFARVLSEADARVTLMQWVVLVHNAFQLSEDGGLGYEFGLRLRASAHGFFGFAVMTARTLREAVDSVTKYIRARAKFEISFAEEGDYAVLELRQLFQLPLENLRRFGIESVLLGMAHLGETITGGRFDGELCFEWPEPPYHARYRDRLPPVRFGCLANQLRFPAEKLDCRLVLADECAHQQALVQVELELATSCAEEGDIAARARAELQLSLDDGYPKFRKLATKLAMSTRTLARKLSAQNTSYQALLEQARYRDARHLLEASSLDVQTIAARIGFDNAANFTRAFKRWTGLTPREVRLAATDRSKT
jgi:AraC-like DNA-binding protein